MFQQLIMFHIIEAKRTLSGWTIQLQQLIYQIFLKVSVSYRIDVSYPETTSVFLLDFLQRT